MPEKKFLFEDDEINAITERKPVNYDSQTPDSIAEACADVLTEEDCNGIAELKTTAEAKRWARERLQIAGIDPDDYFKQKGIK